MSSFNVESMNHARNAKLDDGPIMSCKMKHGKNCVECLLIKHLPATRLRRVSHPSIHFPYSVRDKPDYLHTINDKNVFKPV